jgi:hypothetical protein
MIKQASTIQESDKNRNSTIDVKDKYKISLETQKFILQMCWAQHDSQYYLKAKKEFGIHKANQLNQRVIYSMGKIEARHVLTGLNIQPGSINSIPQIFKLMNTLMDLITPKVMKFQFLVKSETEGFGIVKKCFFWSMVQKSKAESEYTCACNFRHRGWLEAMGVQGEIIPLKLISKGDEICQFKFVLNST